MTEKYTFNWPGKDVAVLQCSTRPKTVLLEDASQGSSSDNILAEGDNLDVLKHLGCRGYNNSVKLCYIDPPYNTGKKFTYSDAGRTTSEWLSFMYPRIYIARQLLRDDGVIFISIDSKLHSELKIMCDEIFGRHNYLTSIAWQKRRSTSSDAKGFSQMHEYIVVYRKSAIFTLGVFPRTAEQNKPYKNDDGDGKGLWRSDNLLVRSFSASGVYPITNPNTNKEHLPPEGSSWRASKSTMDKWLAENRVFFGKDGTGAPQLKRYLHDVKQGRVPTTWWTAEEFGDTSSATRGLKQLFNGATPFDTPKPVSLIRKIIDITTSHGDTVMDFFGGSGTTAAAVLESNIENVSQRHYILIQRDEATVKKSSGARAGYNNIFDITKARIDKKAALLREKYPHSSADLGYRLFTSINMEEDG